MKILFRRLIFYLLIVLTIGNFSCDNPDSKENNDDPSRWSQNGLEDKAIRKLRIFDDQLYAITLLRGLYRRNIANEFSEWQYLGFEDTVSDWRYARGVNDVYINSENKTSILIAVYEADSLNSSILVSDDNGITWFSSDPGMAYEYYDTLYQGSVGEISGVGEIVYGAGGYDGMYKTDNFGKTWNLLYYFNSVYYRGLKVHPINDQILWIISSGPWGGSNISKSSDGGLSWEGLPESFTSLYQFVDDIALHPLDPDIVYVGAQGNIYKTDNFGDTWVQIFSGDSLDISYSFITLNDNQPDHLVVYGSNNTDFRSIQESLDRGMSWREIDYPYELHIYSQPIFDSINEALYFPTNEGILKYIISE